MKKSIFFFAAFIIIGLILAASNSSAQSPNYLWTKSVGGTFTEKAESITTDGKGNIIVGGYFESSSLTFGSTKLTQVGASDLFIVKYDATGNVVWAKSFGGIYSDRVRSVTSDAAGNIIAVGYFDSPSITFDSITLSNSTSTMDLFIVKLDAAGNVQWAKSAGGSYTDEAESVTADPEGNIILAGYFEGVSITFGSITITNIGPTYYSEPFIVKYDAKGNVQWAKSGSGNPSSHVRSISADDMGNIIATGEFKGSITFGTNTLTNLGIHNLFVVKYDAFGNVIWAKTSEESYDDYALAVSATTSGNMIVGGYFESGILTFGSSTLKYTGYKDLFIVKFDSAGNALWAKSAIGDYDDVITSVKVDAVGNIIATGYFGSTTLTFGSTVLTNSTGNFNIFIVKYDVSGNVLWAKSAGSSSEKNIISVTTDELDNIIVTGSYKSKTITFGSTTLFNTDTLGISTDLFIAKLSTTTGIDEITTDNSLSIAPNPFNSEILIKGTEETGEITVLDVIGNEVIRRQLNSSETRINTEDLPIGVYMLRYVSEKRIVRSKLVKF